MPTGRDPVCGMSIDTEDAVEHVEHRGKTYYFCNPSCVSRFGANPEKYVPKSAETAYHPMHFPHKNMTALSWLQLVLATPVILWCGWPLFERAWFSVIHRSPNMFTLIAFETKVIYFDNCVYQKSTAN